MGKAKNSKKKNVNKNINNNNKKKENIPWFAKTWVIVVLLLTLWPLGLFLMWTTKRDWSKSTKVIITIMVLGCTFLTYGGAVKGASLSPANETVAYYQEYSDMI